MHETTRSITTGEISHQKSHNEASNSVNSSQRPTTTTKSRVKPTIHHLELRISDQSAGKRSEKHPESRRKPIDLLPNISFLMKKKKIAAQSLPPPSPSHSWNLSLLSLSKTTASFSSPHHHHHHLLPLHP